MLYIYVIKIKMTPIKKKPEDYEPDFLKACKEGKLHSVQWFLENEYEDKHKKIENEILTDDAPIHIAAKYGSLQIIQYLIEKQNVNKDIKGFVGKTLLHYACEYGHLPIVEYLISKSANIEAKAEYESKTPLHYACENGQLPIVEYLISKGANIEGKDNRGDSIIHIACTYVFSHLFNT